MLLNLCHMIAWHDVNIAYFMSYYCILYVKLLHISCYAMSNFTYYIVMLSHTPICFPLFFLSFHYYSYRIIFHCSLSYPFQRKGKFVDFLFTLLSFSCFRFIALAQIPLLDFHPRLSLEKTIIIYLDF